MFDDDDGDDDDDDSYDFDYYDSYDYDYYDFWFWHLKNIFLQPIYFFVFIVGAICIIDICLSSFLWEVLEKLASKA